MASSKCRAQWLGNSFAEVSGNRLVDGVASAERLPEVMRRVTEGGFGHRPVAEAAAGKPLVVLREHYAELFGPTTGDKAPDVGLLTVKRASKTGWKSSKRATKG